MAKDSDIKRRMDRIEEIIQQLDVDECDLNEGTELHQEGQELLTEVRELLSGEDGKVIELD
ncbi:exodeoxyribonuclease VII small subunit [Halorubrum rutilum]|uniref:Exodeoxyribonuclease VII small subunit n=1 Tax=Halorubrum rutilum TaxID=1364933 RepID=A0ABD6AP24_9EURY